MCAFACPSAGACSSMELIVNRKTTTLITINPIVITGQRRAVMFSCPIGTSI